jgi:hypothetical protein
MAGRAKVGRPHLAGGNASGTELLHKRLLEIEIVVPRTAGPIDPNVHGKLSHEGFSTVIVDFITTTPDPWSDGREDVLS